MGNKWIVVEVAYAKPEEQVILKVEVQEGALIREVIESSGILQRFPEIDLETQRVGVFSEARELTDKVFEGDRVEIYRPLLIDPKDGRRGRVKSKSRKLGGSGFR